MRFSKDVFSQDIFDHADAERRMVPLQQYVKWAAKFQNKISQGEDLISKGVFDCIVDRDNMYRQSCP
jgi:hypothetical protein